MGNREVLLGERPTVLSVEMLTGGSTANQQVQNSRIDENERET